MKTLRLIFRCSAPYFISKLSFYKFHAALLLPILPKGDNIELQGAEQQYICSKNIQFINIGTEYRNIY